MAVLANAAVPRFTCSLATSEAEVREAQRLRYVIFAEEMGAAIDGGPEGLDRDSLDEHCRHLLVRDDTGRLVASTRLLDDAGAAAAGGFYSAHEFAMDAITALPGNKLEVGRTCVDAEFRNGATIATLWSGLADYVAERNIDYLFGCASVPLADRDEGQRMIDLLLDRYLCAPDLRVEPLHPLPPHRVVAAEKPRLPPLLKAYVSLGGRVCGLPCWDADFGCADMFMLVNLRELHPRYMRRFLGPRLADHRQHG